MLTKVPFYHETLRKATIAFGGLFDNLHIVTKNREGTTEKIVKVPVAYAAKDKFIQRASQDILRSDPRSPGKNDVAVQLPRMSFEMTSFTYDASRKLNKIHNITSGLVEGQREFYRNYTPVPYDITWNLYTYTKTTEDNLQIMEQILPFFTPEIFLSVKMIQNPEIIQDIPLGLTSVNTDDSMYEGSMEDRRMIITTYTFEMKLNIYGPIRNMLDPENHFTGDGANGNGGYGVIKRVIVDVNSSRYTAVVDPFEANREDEYRILEGWGDTPPDEVIEGGDGHESH